MTKTPIEELLRQCPSIYKLVVIAAKRAKELTDGSPKFIDTSSKKVTTIALEEIRQSKVQYKPTDDEAAADGEAKPKKRASRETAKAGEKKKS